jgi:S-adenosylmethionine:tRNA ribosyltransferase-isomerase
MNFKKIVQSDSLDPNHETYIPEIFRLKAYQYTLPSDSIAQEPTPCRDAARLLVLDRQTGIIQHGHFRDLPSLLLPSDLLVLNETRVIPAGLTGWKPSGGKVELLVLDPVPPAGEYQSEKQAVRVCLVHSSKHLRQGSVIIVENNVALRTEEIVSPGRVIISFPVAEKDFLQFLDNWGHPPLPPYIDRKGRDEVRDRVRYQTVYSRIPGSVAAPTAGLHFTEDLLGQLAEKGIEIARIVLHVGPGTFVPVRKEDIRLHKMEPEFYDIPKETAESLHKAHKEKRRVIAVGTTTVRTLESAALGGGMFQVGRGKTDLFIIPGYHFKGIQGMVTNFHLPGSTLLMLVSALAGKDSVLNVYEKAVTAGYRFYSFGDSCLII